MTEGRPTDSAPTDDAGEPGRSGDELTLSELLILSSMWMLFGFMLWFYLSPFHGIPAREAAEFILRDILGDSFRQIVAEPNQRWVYQVETNIEYLFRDGTREALGFIINPLVYSYGLPLLFGLVMGSDVSWLRKATILLIGYATITAVQIWGVTFQALKMLAFNFGAQTHDIVRDAGVSDSAIALGYQLGTLILPALAPIFVWVLSNRPLVEQFVGWSVSDLNRSKAS